ncbi:MAG: 3-isopropylmalate dehydratase small subunit [Acidobacteria bacterium]|nr:3-isopropylmalate dehydratase small subunit [Acidobacteriota bacterium]
MERFRTICSRTVVLPIDNIDTDVIIPARFLKVTTREGLGRWLFANWRYDGSGAPKDDFILNAPSAAGAQILVAGDNFGCGSSREHAPWALLDFGIRAVVSTQIASIFRANALKNGLLPVVVDAEFHRRLVDEPGGEVTIDLEAQTIVNSSKASAAFPIDPFDRHCLLQGIDHLTFLLEQEGAIAAYESRTASRG